MSKRQNYEGVGTGQACEWDLVGQLQHRPVLHGPLSVIKSLDVVLTVPGIASTVDRHKSIIHTVDQVHPRGRRG